MFWMNISLMPDTSSDPFRPNSSTMNGLRTTYGSVCMDTP